MATKAQLVIRRTRSVRRSQRWSWVIVAENGRIVAYSGEGYSDRSEALRRGTLVATNGYDVRLPES